MLYNNKLSYFFVLILFVIINFKAFALESLEGAWFECEFSGKTTPPSDNCKMLDNDGFIFSKNKAIHINVIDSNEEKCKKNKVGQCFLSSNKFVNIIKGREDKVIFNNNRLILSFLGCDQVFHLENKNNYVQASPNKKKCFWAGKKVFYLKKFNGKLVFKN